jgi:preprotein translocase subunit SecD
MRRAVLAAAFAAVILGAGCDSGGKPELRNAIPLKAVPPAGHKLTGHDLDRSAEIMERRLDKLGVDGDVRRDGAGAVVVEVPAGTRLPGSVYRSGLLEFYDFEAVLRGAPVARPNPPATVPAGSAVVSCRVATGTCLSTRPLTGTTAFYLLENRPAMTGRDLKLSRTRPAIDPNSNQPVVLVQFTDRGKRVFHEITRREAQRGALACAGQRDSAAVQRCAQHFAIVLDHELVSAPYIDFVRNPGGIPADNGAQIELDTAGDAKRIAVALQTGALPVRLARLP